MSARKRRTANPYVDVRPYAGVPWVDSATIAEPSTPISRRRKKLRWKLAGGCSSGWDQAGVDQNTFYAGSDPRPRVATSAWWQWIPLGSQLGNIANDPGAIGAGVVLGEPGIGVNLTTLTHYLDGFSVHAGDTVSVVIWLLSTSGDTFIQRSLRFVEAQALGGAYPYPAVYALIYIGNVTQDTFAMFYVIGSDPTTYTMPGDTAEWVVENPKFLSQSVLGRFGQVVFTKAAYGTRASEQALLATIGPPGMSYEGAGLIPIPPASPQVTVATNAARAQVLVPGVVGPNIIRVDLPSGDPIVTLEYLC